MAQIFPFRAFRYNLSALPLKDEVSPPYDVVGPSAEKKLRKKPANALHIELPLGANDKKYENAKKIWEQWKKKKIVLQDFFPALYIYEQSFRAHGKFFVRTGFFCEAGLEKPGAGSILRHELTLSKPKEDRLKLLKALKINTSPIFGLFKDEKSEVKKLLNKFSRSKPLAEFKDTDQVKHKIWVCADPGQIEIAQRALKNSPIVIADGHHRYETAWNYYRERNYQPSAISHQRSQQNGASGVLFFLCPMENSGLVIFPTHRILKKGQRGLFQEIEKKLTGLKNIFKVTHIPGSKVNKTLKAGSGSFAVTDGKKYLLVRPVSLTQIKRNLPGKSDPLIRLPLVHLHSILLPEKQKEDFIYTHDFREAVRLANKNKSLAFLVPAVAVQELYSVVSSGDLMPQKSTYFYPKVITGMAFRALEGDF